MSGRVAEEPISSTTNNNASTINNNSSSNNNNNTYNNNNNSVKRDTTPLTQLSSVNKSKDEEDEDEDSSSSSEESESESEEESEPETTRAAPSTNATPSGGGYNSSSQRTGGDSVMARTDIGALLARSAEARRGSKEESPSTRQESLPAALDDASAVRDNETNRKLESKRNFQAKKKAIKKTAGRFAIGVLDTLFG